MPIEDQIREARTSISRATERKTRAQVERDAAKERLEASSATLRDEFGVSSKEDARKRLTELQAELQSEISKAEQALAESES